MGLPEQVMRRLVANIDEEELHVDALFLARAPNVGGRLCLTLPAAAAKQLLESFFDAATTLACPLEVLVLPYASHLHADVDATLDVIAEVGRDLGVRVVRAKAGEDGWPARPHAGRLDEHFLNDLFSRVLRYLAPPLDPVQDEVAFEILRGLFAHTKLGRNNHSHEDDLWKNRGDGLSKREKSRIVSALMGSGILGRKKNDSMGGKGWVYWVDDVGAALSRFPDLNGYVK